MRILTALVLTASIVLGFSCTPSPEKQAKALIAKSIVAHGGAESWNDMSSLKFRKWARLLNEDGSVESELDQWHEFRFQPYFEGKITWTKDSITHRSIWDGAKMSYFMGENEIKNESFLAAKKKDFDAAFYAVAQPWKLLDEGTTLTYEGQRTLENGNLAEVIRVDYGQEADIWWYYFDPETFGMIGNEVQLKDHRSLVYNLSFEEVNGFKLHGKRESWRVNEKGEKLFLRAEYRYSEYQIHK
ncbi:hypothetical protein [Algoriphagus boritolerans]|uniref:Uncharacterized protein n=1 Tax=Algoriphagus boritolerans DSM 17298 = JCM 18970 TaxID=1120964 RepID=A0A1H5WK70_9BACT|nr:hypothetical protein [Algoriphagus boritolerans]SEF99701.1 hypothetical protein SAMN03080598_02104 [Algoriphagus boritolerans DSM 17298 = JCM 18970]